MIRTHGAMVLQLANKCLLGPTILALFLLVLLAGCGGGGGATGVGQPPVISGAPPTQVAVWNLYDFTPSASDPDGEPLSFSITGMPPWASFDLTTGQLSGTPSVADIRVFSDISISVSDGATSTKLPAFSITVVRNTSVATLSWTAPTERTDGSPLPPNLGGYKIYFGPSEGNYTELDDLDNPGLNLYVTRPLSPGIYYFVITAYDSAGLESDFSNVASATTN